MVMFTVIVQVRVMKMIVMMITAMMTVMMMKMKVMMLVVVMKKMTNKKMLIVVIIVTCMMEMRILTRSLWWSGCASDEDEDYDAANVLLQESGPRHVGEALRIKKVIRHCQHALDTSFRDSRESTSCWKIACPRPRKV